MAIRYAPVTNTTGKPSAPTSSPAALAAFKPEYKPTDKPKPQAKQPVDGSHQPGKRGRKPSADPKQHVTLRLHSSLVADLDAQTPDWKAEIEKLLRDYLAKST